MTYELQINYLADLLEERGRINTLKQIGAAPVGLSKFDYIAEVLPNIDDFMITDKADGTRGIIEINEQNAKAIIGSAYIEFKISGSSTNTYVLDCEILEDKKIILIFDILMAEGKKIIDEPFSSRHNYMIGLKLPKGDGWEFRLKKYIQLTTGTYAKNIMGLYNDMKKYIYNTDGIIFTKNTNNYMNSVHYKWKPPEHLTIDFLAIKSADSSNTILLHSGITKRMYRQLGLNELNALKISQLNEWTKMHNGAVISDFFPIVFMPSIMPNAYKMNIKGIDSDDIHKKIIEVSWNKEKSEWLFHRIRTDRDVELKSGKYYGNNYRIAELTFQMAINPLTIADLTAPLGHITQNFYFEKSDDKYKAARNFNTYVKGQLIARTQGQHYVMDMASGKGQDLWRYYNAKIKCLMTMDIDASALDELITRKYNISKTIRIDGIDRPLISSSECATNILTANLDLNKRASDNINKLENTIPWIQKNKIDSIICNMALHYMMEDEAHINNIAEFIAYWLKDGGEFIFTSMMAADIHKLLENNDIWERDPYRIEYVDSKKKKIKVLLPCSRDMREEPLVDLTKLDIALKNLKIIRIATKSFNEYLFKYEKINELSETDRLFVSLYGYCIYKRINF
jgi:SAM-dependent methyltransferase